MREEGKVSWEHKNLQFRTAPKLGVHARLSEQDLAELEPWQRDGWEVSDSLKGAPGRPHIARWHFEYGVEVVEEGDVLVATRGGAGLRMLFGGQSRVKLYRDDRWLGKNPFRRGEAVPWVVDVYFRGSGQDRLVTRFDILRRRR